MRIINRAKLDGFKRKHPHSRKSLDIWEKIVSQTDFKDFNALKLTFAKADYLAVGGYTIFDISGNKYRLITQIEYAFRLVEIKIIWTHNEYSHPKSVYDLKSGKI